MEYLIIGIIVLVLMLPYLLMRVSTCAMVGKPAPAMDDVISSNTDMEKPVYLYFMSERCSNCKKMTPVIEEQGRQNPNVITINISNEREKGVRFGVRGTPTLLSVKDGVIERVKLGAMTRHKILDFISA